MSHQETPAVLTHEKFSLTLELDENQLQILAMAFEGFFGGNRERTKSALRDEIDRCEAHFQLEDQHDFDFDTVCAMPVYLKMAEVLRRRGFTPDWCGSIVNAESNEEFAQAVAEARAAIDAADID